MKTIVWTRDYARRVLDRLGVEGDFLRDLTDDEIVAAVAEINYGDGAPSENELDDLRRALEILRDA